MKLDDVMDDHVKRLEHDEKMVIWMYNATVKDGPINVMMRKIWDHTTFVQHLQKRVN